MIVPDAGDTCQACGGKATGFHPYTGFVCPTHLAEAQQHFNAVSSGVWEGYGDLKKQLQARKKE